jgi:hypothetical protein
MPDSHMTSFFRTAGFQPALLLFGLHEEKCLNRSET